MWPSGLINVVLIVKYHLKREWDAVLEFALAVFAKQKLQMVSLHIREYAVKGRFSLLRRFFGMIKMETNIAGISMKNPLITASGTCGYGRELAELFDLSLLGGISVKGTTVEARLGNPPPRIAETACGMLNSVGLQNPGVDAVITKEIPFLHQYDTQIIVNIAGHIVSDYGVLAEKLDVVKGIAALEVNISCPNVAKGGMAFGVDADIAGEVISLVKAKTKLPVIAKLSPNVTDITEIAKACEAAGADALSLINTIMSMSIDIDTRKPLLANNSGGLSGPAIKPVALYQVWRTSQAVSIPLIGMGGISSATDAIEFMLAGASAFQIGSILFKNPYAAVQILEELDSWCGNHGIKDINELVGAME
jgi:dihydroorotate dehydrogenase (NAD+) catalytic subunit